MKQLTFFEKIEALKSGKTLVWENRWMKYNVNQCVFETSQGKYTIPYAIEGNWQIKPEPKTRIMTAFEALEFMLRDEFKGRVVRFGNDDWKLHSHFNYEDENIQHFEHALLKDGQISDIRKFEKEIDE